MTGANFEISESSKGVGIEKAQNKNDSTFLQCPLGLHQLVDKYFKPHIKGFSKKLIDMTFSLDIPDTTIVQVLSGKIYIGRLSNLNQAWDRSRFQTMLLTLSNYLERLKEACKASVSTRHDACNVDFEFVMVILLRFLVMFRIPTIVGLMNLKVTKKKTSGTNLTSTNSLF